MQKIAFLFKFFWALYYFYSFQECITLTAIKCSKGITLTAIKCSKGFKAVMLKRGFIFK